MPRAPNASRTAAGVPARWCMRIFKDHDAEGVWSWFAALSSQSMARRSVLSLWHQYRGRTRQLFGDAEMRRRIMGIKNSEYVALSKCTVQSIVDGWRAPWRPWRPWRPCGPWRPLRASGRQCC